MSDRKLETEEQPGHAAFEKTELNLGKPLQHPIEYDRGERNHLPQRMADRVYRGIRVQPVHAHAAVHAAMDGNTARQFIGGLVNRGIDRIAQRCNLVRTPPS